jgi:hypothetical protein
MLNFYESEIKQIDAMKALMTLSNIAGEK